MTASDLLPPHFPPPPPFPPVWVHVCPSQAAYFSGDVFRCSIVFEAPPLQPSLPTTARGASSSPASSPGLALSLEDVNAQLCGVVSTSSSRQPLLASARLHAYRHLSLPHTRFFRPPRRRKNSERDRKKEGGGREEDGRGRTLDNDLARRRQVDGRTLSEEDGKDAVSPSFSSKAGSFSSSSSVSRSFSDPRMTGHSKEEEEEEEEEDEREKKGKDVSSLCVLPKLDDRFLRRGGGRGASQAKASSPDTFLLDKDPVYLSVFTSTSKLVFLSDPCSFSSASSLSRSSLLRPERRTVSSTPTSRLIFPPSRHEKFSYGFECSVPAFLPPSFHGSTTKICYYLCITGYKKISSYSVGRRDEDSEASPDGAGRDREMSRKDVKTAEGHEHLVPSRHVTTSASSSFSSVVPFVVKVPVRLLGSPSLSSNDFMMLPTLGPPILPLLSSSSSSAVPSTTCPRSVPASDAPSSSPGSSSRLAGRLPEVHPSSAPSSLPPHASSSSSPTTSSRRFFLPNVLRNYFGGGGGSVSQPSSSTSPTSSRIASPSGWTSSSKRTDPFSSSSYGGAVYGEDADRSGLLLPRDRPVIRFNFQSRVWRGGTAQGQGVYTVDVSTGSNERLLPDSLRLSWSFLSPFRSLDFGRSRQGGDDTVIVGERRYPLNEDEERPCFPGGGDWREESRGEDGDDLFMLEEDGSSLEHALGLWCCTRGGMRAFDGSYVDVLTSSFSYPWLSSSDSSRGNDPPGKQPKESVQGGQHHLVSSSASSPPSPSSSSSSSASACRQEQGRNATWLEEAPQSSSAKHHPEPRSFSSPSSSRLSPAESSLSRSSRSTQKSEPTENRGVRTPPHVNGNEAHHGPNPGDRTAADNRAENGENGPRSSEIPAVREKGDSPSFHEKITSRSSAEDARFSWSSRKDEEAASAWVSPSLLSLSSSSSSMPPVVSRSRGPSELKILGSIVEGDDEEDDVYTAHPNALLPGGAGGYRRFRGGRDQYRISQDGKLICIISLPGLYSFLSPSSSERGATETRSFQSGAGRREGKGGGGGGSSVSCSSIRPNSSGHDSGRTSYSTMTPCVTLGKSFPVHLNLSSAVLCKTYEIHVSIVREEMPLDPSDTADLYRTPGSAQSGSLHPGVMPPSLPLSSSQDSHSKTASSSSLSSSTTSFFSLSGSLQGHQGSSLNHHPRAAEAAQGQRFLQPQHSHPSTATHAAQTAVGGREQSRSTGTSNGDSSGGAVVSQVVWNDQICVANLEECTLYPCIPLAKNCPPSFKTDTVQVSYSLVFQFLCRPVAPCSSDVRKSSPAPHPPPPPPGGVSEGRWLNREKHEEPERHGGGLPSGSDGSSTRIGGERKGGGSGRPFKSADSVYQPLSGKIRREDVLGLSWQLPLKALPPLSCRDPSEKNETPQDVLWLGGSWEALGDAAGTAAYDFRDEMIRMNSHVLSKEGRTRISVRGQEHDDGERKDLGLPLEADPTPSAPQYLYSSVGNAALMGGEWVASMPRVVCV